MDAFRSDQHYALKRFDHFNFITERLLEFGENLIIEWIGDLDGDGKMDILLSLPDDNCGYDERLYLSSQAGQGEIVHKAAQLSGREAACGC